MAQEKTFTPRIRLASVALPPHRVAMGPDAMLHVGGVAGAGPGPGPAGKAGSDRPTDRNAPDTLFRLRILATSDIHAQLLSYDYFANRPQFGMGLAQTASLIARARAETPGAVLLDNGDFLQGSILAELAANGRSRRRPHPAIAAFNTLGYDAVALGNHEFNYGLAALGQALASARFPVLSANVALSLGADPTQDRLLARPYTLIRRRVTAPDGTTAEVTLGVLGLTPPEIMQWDKGRLSGRLRVRPMVQAALAWLPQMRRDGADVVVVLAHTGISDLAHRDRSEGLATEIAEIDGVDVVIAGHSHEVFPNGASWADPRIDGQAGRLAGKPAVQPGHSGSHLGIVDLDLSRDAAGRWITAEARVRAVSASEQVAGMTPQAIRHDAAPLRNAIAADHRAALTWTRQTIGQSQVALTTCFALAADVQAMRLLAAAKTAHARRLLQGRPEATLPVLATVRPLRSGGRGGPLNFTEIPAGPLSVRHVYDLYPYPNTLVLSCVTGRLIRKRLDTGSRLFHTLHPGQPDQMLLDQMVPSFSFEAIPGLSYRIDLAHPQGRPGRIRDLRHDGRPVADDDRFVLVSNSYLLGTAPDLLGTVLLADGPPVTDAISEHLRQSGPLTAQTGGGWGFAPMPGTSVLFDSGVAAMAHLDEVAHLRPELLGITEAGFHRFRLHL